MVLCFVFLFAEHLTIYVSSILLSESHIFLDWLSCPWVGNGLKLTMLCLTRSRCICKTATVNTPSTLLFSKIPHPLSSGKDPDKTVRSSSWIPCNSNPKQLAVDWSPIPVFTHDWCFNFPLSPSWLAEVRNCTHSLKLVRNKHFWVFCWGLTVNHKPP